MRLIAIDGHGGSGKSTLAAWLAERLHAEVVHTDDFASWDNPVDWWPDLIRLVLEPLSSGATSLSYPRAKWWEAHHPEPVRDQPVTRVMILEGVSSFRREFRPYVDLSIFVRTPPEVCLERGFQRDRGIDGKSDEEIRSMWAAWHEQERRHFAEHQTLHKVDLVLDGTQPWPDQASLTVIDSKL